MDDHYALEMFSPDETLVADGYSFALWRQCEPERNLLAAVLKDALLTYKKHFSAGDARFREAELWILSEDADRLFAFRTVCSMLSVSAERIRKDLRDFARAIGAAPGFDRPRRARLIKGIERREQDRRRETAPEVNAL